MMICRQLSLIRFALVAIILVMMAPAAFSEETATSSKKTVKTVTTTITTKVTEGEETESGEAAEKAPSDDRVLTATFGSRGASGLSGCKTGDALTLTIKELKSDCAAWMKDRKTDLKEKYLTGSCEEVCEACSMGLQRCSVSGIVHYKTK